MNRTGKRLGQLGFRYYHSVYTIMKEKTETKTIKYKPYPIRMNEKTMKRLNDKRLNSGLSWNLFLLDLLDNQKTGAKRRKPYQII